MEILNDFYVFLPGIKMQFVVYIDILNIFYQSDVQYHLIDKVYLKQRLLKATSAARTLIILLF